MVNKETYNTWEQKVIQYYESKGRKFTKHIIPKINNPSVVYKQKVIICLDMFIKNVMPLSAMTHLPISIIKRFINKKNKLLLYHSGKQGLDSVSYGFDEEKQKLIVPAIDVGGLTNGRWDINKNTNNYNTNIKNTNNYNNIKIKNNGNVELDKNVNNNNNDQKLLLTDVFISKNTRLTYSYITNIYNMWLNVSNRSAFYGGKVRQNLFKTLSSLRKIGTICRIVFNPMKKEKRIIVKAEQVLKDIGSYYVRDFGKGNNMFAKVATKNEISKLYCAISISDNKYVTPNINILNLQNEYILGNH